jgi:hypothetical protein
MASMESYLTPTEFFFWGFMKDIIYREKAQCVADLRQWITAAITIVPLHMLSQVWNEVEYCYNNCRAVSSVHIELH